MRKLDRWMDNLNSRSDGRILVSYVSIMSNLLRRVSLQSLLKRLRHENRVNRYDEEIAKLVEKVYAEKVPADEINASPNSAWYLPHQPLLG